MSQDKTMTVEEQASELDSDGVAPPCLFWNPDNGAGAKAYAEYNNGGPQETRGLNYLGERCPQWLDLPAVVRAKWNAVGSRNSAAQELDALRQLLDAHAVGDPAPDNKRLTKEDQTRLVNLTLFLQTAEQKEEHFLIRTCRETAAQVAERIVSSGNPTCSAKIEFDEGLPELVIAISMEPHVTKLLLEAVDARND